MKDIMQKLAELEATAPKATAKKLLTEDSTTPPANVSNKPASLKDVFETMATKQSIPVVGKEGGTQTTGAGFINVTDNSPAAQALGKAVGDLAAQKKLQIVVPNAGQQAGQPAAAGATGQAPVGATAVKEKWGTDTKVSPSEKGKYAGKSKAELTSAYNKLKASGPHKKGSPEFGKMRELAFAIRAKSDWGKVQEGDEEGQAHGIAGQLVSGAISTIGDMAGDVVDDVVGQVLGEGQKVDRMVKHIEKSERKLGKSKEKASDIAWATANKRGMLDNKNKKKVDEILNVKLSKRDPSEETKWNRNGWPLIKQPSAKAHLGAAQYHDEQANKWKAQFRDALKNPDMPEKGKEAYKWEIQRNNQEAKRHRLAAKNFDAVKEADIPSTQGIDTQGVNLGAGRSMTTLEGKEPQVEVIDNAFNRENYKDLIGKKYPKSKAPAYARVKEISEGKKPDFLDLDKDGNKKEPMKKAAADKKKQKVKESMNHRISAARLEGKSHGLKGHAYHGKAYEDLEEMKAYHEGYIDGLNECYGQGVYETAPAMPAATVPGMANQALDEGEPGAGYSPEMRERIKNATPRELSAMAQDLAGSGGFAGYDYELKMLKKAQEELRAMEEGNAFTKALKDTPKGGKFSVGGKSFTDTSSLEEYAFESADLDEAVFNPMGKVARELRGLKGIVKDTPHAQLPGVMGAGAGAAVGIPAAATAGAVGAAFLPIIGASALGGYGLLKAGQLTGKVLNFLAQKLFGTKEEALAFAKAHLEAARAGETSFQHNGKTYKVSLKPGQISQLYGDIEDLTSQIKNKELDKRLAPDTTMGKIGAALKEDPVFESWDSQLKALVNEGSEVNEGMSVSISKGQQNSPDSVTITAQDQEADELLAFVKQAGLGLFGDEATHEPSSAMSLQPAQGGADEVGAGGVDIDVVDDSDSMLSLMKKLGGVEQSGSADYADEEGDEDCGCGEEETNEATCNECGGMMEAGHSCGDKEMVDEVESEDQQLYNVAEDNPPDSGATDSVADEDAEAEEDKALATKSMNESFTDILARLNALSEGSGDEPKHPEHDKKDDKDYDDAEEEDEESEELDEGKWNYPKHMTKTVTTSDMDTTNASRNREERKAWRKKEKAKAHAALMKGEPKKEKDEELNEWANQVGKGPGKGTDASFEEDIEFMTKVIAGGLNKPKSTGQTTIPVIPGQVARMHDHSGSTSDTVDDWVKLAGIK